MDIAEFRKTILSHYQEEGRSLPWRDTHDPWAIMVSEFMLQQTQTDRVIPYWKRWTSLWPSPASLAASSLEEVLREWSGLGYNRRARFLKEAASVIVSDFDGEVPRTPELLQGLPGVGPYTSRAIACFAYNYPSVFVETNIRSVFIHFFFQDRSDVPDGDILPLIEESLDREEPRVWYWALMDYGAALKKLTPNPNRKSRHYAKQSAFEGSRRQVRGAIIRSLAADGPGSMDALRKRSGYSGSILYDALESLKKESMVAESDGIYRIP